MKSKSKTTKQFFQMSSSIIMTMGLQVVVSVFLARLLAPEEFSVYKQIINFGLLLQSIFTFGIPITLSYFIVNSKEKYKEYVNTALSFIIVISVIAILSSYALMFFQNLLNFSIISSKVLAFAPLSFFPIMIYFAEFIYMGTNKISTLAFQKILAQALIILLILTSYLIFKEINLLIILVIYFLSNLGIFIYQYIKLKLSLNYNKEVIKKVIKKNKVVGLQTYIGSLFSVMSTRLFTILIATFILPGEYALFSLAVTLSGPLGPLIASIGSVLFQKFSTVTRLSKKSILAIVGTSIGIFITYSLAAYFMIPILYGEFYEGSIFIAIFLALGNIIVGVGDIFNRFLLTKGKGKEIRNSAIFAGIINISLGFALISNFMVVGIIFAKTLSNLVYFSAMIYSYRKFVKGEESK